jgi:hypothetical protein
MMMVVIVRAVRGVGMSVHRRANSHARHGRASDEVTSRKIWRGHDSRKHLLQSDIFAAAIWLRSSGKALKSSVL